MPVRQKVNLTEKLSQSSEKYENIQELENQIPQMEKQHKCLDCGAGFSFLWSLKKHMMIHTGEKPHECPYCSRRFRISQTLKCHMMTHTGEKPYKCLYCNKRFIQVGARKVHMMTHTGEKPHTCSACNKGFITAASLKVHAMRRHDVDKPYICSHCPDTFGTPSSLKRHMASHSDKNMCKDKVSPLKAMHNSGKSSPVEAGIEDTRDEEISSQSRTVDHKPCNSSAGNSRHPNIETLKEKKVCTIEKCYKCSYCSKGFRAAAGLRTHIMTHTGEKPYNCSDCGKRFTTSGNLRAHLRTHTGEKPYKCTHCDKAFIQTTNFMLHMMNHHVAEKPHKCPHCPLTFVTPTSLKVHMTGHSDKEKYDYEELSPFQTKKGKDKGRSSEGTSSMPTDVPNPNTDHEGDNHPEPPVWSNIAGGTRTEYIVHKPHKCPSCFKAFRQPSGLKAHMQDCHRVEKPYKCSHCPKSFHGPSYLKVHETTHKGEKSHTCPHCPSKFGKRSALELHMLTHMGKKSDNKLDKKSELNKNRRDEDETKYTQLSAPSTTRDPPKTLYRCPVCKRGFSFQHNLKRHETIHTGKKPHQCPHCSKTFRLSADVKSHMMTHTGQRSNVCSHCGKGFTQRSSLIKHQQIHQKASAHSTISVPPKRLYKCCVCNRGFSFQHNLKRHETIHTREKPHQCLHCSKTFRLSTDLKLHMVTHTREKHHVCSHCGKGFAHRSRLKKHLKIHQKASASCTVSGAAKKLYRCPVCKRGFSFQHNLKRHQTIHTGQKPYLCVYCSKTFRLSADLKSHMTTHTGGKHHVCSHCGQGFAQISRLKNHLQTHQKAGKTKQAFHDFTGLKKDKDTDIQDTYNNFEREMIHRACIRSDKVTPNYHLHTLDDVPEAKLTECSSNSPIQETLVLQIDQQPYKCSQCDASFRYQTALKKHTMTHIGKKPYQCSVCDSDFRSCSTLKKHMLIHERERPYKCCHCSKTFRSSSTMRYHVMIHTGEKPQKCSYCDQRFIQINSLKWHLRTQHKEEEARKCSGSELSAKYVSMNRDNPKGSKTRGKSKGSKIEQNHDQIKLHEKLKTARCSEGISHLHPTKVQMISKKIEDPHMCSVCGAVSSSAYKLTLHLHTHMDKEAEAEHANSKSSPAVSAVSIQNTEDKPYTCSECGWSFRYKTDYRRHQKVHSGEKPYKCSYCLKTFRKSSTLKTHAMLHTGERPHVCLYCGKGFIQTNSLNFHLRSHHNDKDSLKCSESEKNLDCAFVSQSHKESQNKDKLNREEPISEEIKATNSEVNNKRYSGNGNIHEKSKNPEHNIEMVPDQNLTKTDLIIQSMKHCCECSVCGKVLSTTYNLAVHRRIHTGERPYTCAICKKSFRTYSAAICHTRAHTKKGRLPGANPRDLMKKQPGAHRRLIQKNVRELDTKVKSCPKCDEFLKDSVDMKFHAAVHKTEKYSRCNVCVQGFYLPEDLENHVFICHRSFILC